MKRPLRPCSNGLRLGHCFVHVILYLSRERKARHDTMADRVRQDSTQSHLITLDV